jgi:hypothetical protein
MAESFHACDNSGTRDGGHNDIGREASTVAVVTMGGVREGRPAWANDRTR